MIVNSHTMVGSFGRARGDDNRAAAVLWMTGPDVDNARKAR